MQFTSEKRVEILSIGNEVLQGDVLDTNAHWLCRQFASLGARPDRVTVLPDTPDEIGGAVRAAIERGTAILVTCGGLGPTSDDLTVASVATALGVSLHEHHEARLWVEAFYLRLHAQDVLPDAGLTPERLKMAVLPAGAEPLRNSAGAAPGIWLREGEAIIALLPGVPAEMKAIFTEELAPRLAEMLPAGVLAQRTLTTDSRDESVIASVVSSVAARYPRLYVKSRAQAYGVGDDHVFVVLTARDGAGTEELDEAAAMLQQLLNARGVRSVQTAE